MVPGPWVRPTVPSPEAEQCRTRRAELTLESVAAIIEQVRVRVLHSITVIDNVDKLLFAAISPARKWRKQKSVTVLQQASAKPARRPQAGPYELGDPVGVGARLWAIRRR